MSRPSRRALEQVGGTVATRGESLRASALRRALEAVDEEPGDDLTHGFHTYPARMHPAIPRTLLESLIDPGAVVLDPFCGGGTVLVEARRIGARAIGVDLNPLAARLAEVKCMGLTPKQRRRIVARIDEVALATRAGEGGARARAPLSRAEAQWYAPHVLAELGALRAAITSGGAVWEQRMLLMVLSSMVVKVSRQESDTSEKRVDKHVRKGFVTDFFVAKAGELVERETALYEAVPRGTPEARIIEGDVRHLGALLGRTRVDLILTSPPYGGTYDYVTHHARRYPWLGLQAERFHEGELGARRRMKAVGPRGWDAELVAALRAMAAVMAPSASMLLLLGDGEVRGKRMPADEQVERLAARAGLELVAVASQARRDWKGGADRREHLLWLESAG